MTSTVIQKKSKLTVLHASLERGEMCLKMVKNELDKGKRQKYLKDMFTFICLKGKALM